MVNKGSSVAATQVVNVSESLRQVREGQIKMFAYDQTGATWAKYPLIPYQPAPLTTIAHDVLPLPSAAGPAVRFPNVTCNTAILKASRGNAGVVWIGGSLVSNVNGYELDPGECVAVSVSNLNLLYALPEVNADSVRYLVVV